MYSTLFLTRHLRSERAQKATGPILEPATSRSAPPPGCAALDSVEGWGQERERDIGRDAEAVKHVIDALRVRGEVAPVRDIELTQVCPSA